MANQKTAAAPSQDEINAANEVLRRADEIRRQQEAEATKPISDLARSPEFSSVAEAVEALDPSFLANPNIGPHIMAIRAGFTGLGAMFPPEAASQPEG